MKVIHVIKRIEDIDNDIRELKKLERSVKKNKSFTTPIFMSIEKQINLLLGDRIKLLDLRIENPPEALKKQIEGDEEKVRPAALAKAAPAAEKKKKAPKPKKTVREEPVEEEEFDDDQINILTQDQIDAKISSIESDRQKTKSAAPKPSVQKTITDPGVKILDIALEKGTLAADDEEKKDKEKKVKFFRDNFPVE